MGEWFNDVIHPKGSFCYNYTLGTCKVGESVSQRIINFPVNIHSYFNNKDLEKINTIFNEELDKLCI